MVQLAIASPSRVFFVPSIQCPLKQKRQPEAEIFGLPETAPIGGSAPSGRAYLLAVRISFPGLEKVRAISRSALDGGSTRPWSLPSDHT
jgi:hypothetical protein